MPALPERVRRIGRVLKAGWLYVFGDARKEMTSTDEND